MLPGPSNHSIYWCVNPEDSSTYKKYLTNYRPQSELWEGNVFTPVCDSVHRAGVYPNIQWAGGVPPWADTPQADTPYADNPPLGRHPD